MDDEDKGRGRGDKVYRVVVVDCPAGLFNEDKLTKRESKQEEQEVTKVGLEVTDRVMIMYYIHYTVGIPAVLQCTRTLNGLAAEG